MGDSSEFKHLRAALNKIQKSTHQFHSLTEAYEAKGKGDDEESLKDVFSSVYLPFSVVVN